MTVEIPNSWINIPVQKYSRSVLSPQRKPGARGCPLNTRRECSSLQGGGRSRWLTGPSQTGPLAWGRPPTRDSKHGSPGPSSTDFWALSFQLWKAITVFFPPFQNAPSPVTRHQP